MENTQQEEQATKEETTLSATEPQASPMAAAPVSKSAYLLPASIILAAILISGSILVLVGRSQPAAPSGGTDGTTTSTITLPPAISGSDVILGDPKAPVSIIEYADYQCPFCGRFYQQTEPLIRDQYIKTGKVKMVYRDFQFLGPESIAAANAAGCAKDQNQFWAYHDAIYNTELADGHENNGNLTRTLFIQLAQQLKLDIPTFTQCLDSNKYQAQITQDTNNASQVGVNSTPTIFIDDQKVIGAQPFTGTAGGGVTPIKPIIDAELSKLGK